MKRALTVILCTLGFILLTAPTAVEYHPVFLNGKPFGNAAVINGKFFFPLSDFAKLGGGTVSLEEVGLTLTGNNTLKISSAAVDMFHKHNTAVKIDAHEKPQTAAPSIDAQYKPQTPSSAIGDIKGRSPNARWARQNDGVITNNAIRYGGGVFFPLSDLARAFGGTFTAPAANLAPGAAIQLNFTKTPTALLIGLL